MAKDYIKDREGGLRLGFAALVIPAVISGLASAVAEQKSEAVKEPDSVVQQVSASQQAAVSTPPKPLPANPNRT